LPKLRIGKSKDCGQCLRIQLLTLLLQAAEGVALKLAAAVARADI
jgi:hypothetical protein